MGRSEIHWWSHRYIEIRRRRKLSNQIRQTAVVFPSPALYMCLDSNDRTLVDWVIEFLLRPLFFSSPSMHCNAWKNIGKRKEIKIVSTNYLSEFIFFMNLLISRVIVCIRKRYEQYINARYMYHKYDVA